MTTLLLLAFFFAPQRAGSLSGTVVDAVTGRPVAGVQLVLEPLDTRPARPPSTVSDERGGFTLADLGPGHYRLRGIRDGYPDTWYGARRPDSYGTVIALAAGQGLAGLELKLRPFASMEGTIRDPDGRPAGGVSVSLARQSWVGGVRRVAIAARATTDESGRYHVPALLPGKYYVRVEDRVAATLYPGVIDPASATAIDVAAGVRISGIDVTLVRTGTFRVKGRAVVPQGTAPATLHLENGPTELGFALGTRAGRDGAFEFRGVPPGVYTLSGLTNSTEMQYRARMRVTVADADVPGVVLSIVPGAEVVCRVKVEGGGRLPLAGAIVVFAGEDGSTQSVARQEEEEEQTLTANVNPGRYTVYFNPSGNTRALYVKRIRSGSVDVLRDGLTISQAGRVPLEILAASDVGRVEGLVVDAPGDQPAGGATVVLVPAATTPPRIDRFQEGVADQGGRFAFAAVPPGDYRLYAWEEIESGAWYEPGFLAKYAGQNVTVRGNGRVTARLRVADR